MLGTVGMLGLGGTLDLPVRAPYDLVSISLGLSPLFCILSFCFPEAEEAPVGLAGLLILS